MYAQSCLTLCDPLDCSPPGSSVHGILQERIMEWVAIPFSRGSSWPRVQTRVSCIAGRSFTVWATREDHSLCKVKEVKSLSHVRLFVTPWTVAHQAPPSMGFSKQEYWSGLPLPGFEMNFGKFISLSSRFMSRYQNLNFNSSYQPFYYIFYFFLFSSFPLGVFLTGCLIS